MPRGGLKSRAGAAGNSSHEDDTGTTMPDMLVLQRDRRTGRLQMLDARTMEWTEIRMARQPGCAVCGEARRCVPPCPMPRRRALWTG
mgnify:CR=1 FL=1